MCSATAYVHDLEANSEARGSLVARAGGPTIRLCMEEEEAEEEEVSRRSQRRARARIMAACMPSSLCAWRARCFA